MRTRFVLPLLGMFALSIPLANCQDPSSSSPEQADIEGKALHQRVLDIQARIQAAGEITKRDYEELDEVKRDILSWQDEYGRDDIGFETGPRPTATPETGDGDPAIATVPTYGGGDPTTWVCSCDDVTTMGGKICFLVEIRDCNWGSWTCVYECFYFPIWF